MVTVSEGEDGELDYDLSDDDILIQFDICIPTYVPAGNDQQTEALKEELARRLWWDSDDITITHVSVDSDGGLRHKFEKPDYETYIEGTYYVG